LALDEVIAISEPVPVQSIPVYSVFGAIHGLVELFVTVKYVPTLLLSIVYSVPLLNIGAPVPKSILPTTIARLSVPVSSLLIRK